MLNGCGNTAGSSGINARPTVLPRCWRWMVANRCRAILIFRLHQKFCKARGCGSAMHHLAIRCRAVGFQAETFAKPVTDGALAARRHFDKSVMRCLINVGDEPSPLHFRFQAALIRHHTRAIIIGSLKTGKLVFRLPILFTGGFTPLPRAARAAAVFQPSPCLRIRKCSCFPPCQTWEWTPAHRNARA